MAGEGKAAHEEEAAHEEDLRVLGQPTQRGAAARPVPVSAASLGELPPLAALRPTLVLLPPAFLRRL